MSSAGTTDPKPYYCYKCERTVSISLFPSSDLLCPVCHGGFLEEYENPNPNPSPHNHPFFSDHPFSSPLGLAGLPLVLSSATGGFVLQQPSSDPSARRSSSSVDADAFNPFLFLQNYLQTLMSDGANIQFVIENGSDHSATALRLPANFGDYFLGPGLEQLIQQLAENDPNRYGTPPASKNAVESLPDIKVSEQMLSSDSAQCAVCMDTFELGAEAKQMPCKHVYHPDCILPWLALHNSCPVCRFELPTDDPDYDEHRIPPAPANQTAANAALGSGSSGTGQGDSGATQTAERRFRISLPWPFRASGSPDEASNSGFGSHNDSNRSNDGERNLNSGNRDRNQNSDPETKQEDLD